MSSTTSSRTFVFTPPPDGAPVGWVPSNADDTSTGGEGGLSKTVLAIVLTISGVLGFWLIAMMYWIYSIRKLNKTKLLAQQSTEGRRQTWIDSTNIPSPPISPMTHTFGFGIGIGRNTHNNVKSEQQQSSSSNSGSSYHRQSITSTLVGSEYTIKSSEGGTKGILKIENGEKDKEERRC
ncbi:hypothetical protein L486_02993 [Kwoniella mangroviensis CBS 10435]|uniref:Uncharacterized protein n=1 Tax=Kwoniella mangroviensis CBS 10435 TaxID=1331196 RepID=A0A1B9IXS4_9TREE|nr:hypothetical protein L486_02993 [Kwoniella mangroviensis CBS 10435]